jgi:uncharacterized FAD-dependent dehydrogenase
MTQQQRQENFDVIIIGAGPAGLFAAHELRESSTDLSILILDAGPDVGERSCPADSSGCKDCVVCKVLGGVGGAGLHSDGKLVLDLSAGGYLEEWAGLSVDESSELVNAVASTIKRFDGDAVDGPRLAVKRRWHVEEQFRKSNLELKLYSVRHLGTENLKRIMARFTSFLCSDAGEGRSRISIRSSTPMTSFDWDGTRFTIKSPSGDFTTSQLVLAVGKSGAPQLRRDLRTLGIPEEERATWVGVRVEVPSTSARELLELSFDPKISQQIEPGRRVKTHCFCRNGDLLIMKYRNAYLVGGHSPLTERNLFASGMSGIDGEANRKVNFNVLASRSLGQDRIDILLAEFRRAGKSSVVWQSMRSFLDVSEPNPAKTISLAQGIPARSADVRQLLDGYEGIGRSIAGFLQDLGKHYPGIIDGDGRVFAPAMEWDFGTVRVTGEMETSIPGLFVVGDGAGLSQGIVHAGATGILAARAIQTRF